jgi:hypothetical protein
MNDPFGPFLGIFGVKMAVGQSHPEQKYKGQGREEIEHDVLKV